MYILLSCWILVSQYFVKVSSQVPGLSSLALLHVERNWYVRKSEPIGSLVERAYKDRVGDETVTFGLETFGPPAPFAIDPRTGDIRVNDTLLDKENRSYSLWVTADDGSTIPQRKEVFATIIGNNGQRTRFPFPSLPSFLPQPPSRTTPRSTKYPKFPLPPEYPNFPGDDNIFNDQIFKTTKKPQPKTPEDIPKVYPEEVSEDSAHVEVTTERSPELKTKEDSTSNTSISSTAETSSDIPITVIPLVAIGALVFIVAAVLIYVWKKYSRQKSKSKKEDLNKDAGIVMQDTLNPWERQRAYSNRYEAWDTNHLQISDESSITKEEPPDDWEFPRHRLRIFNIVGEGAFGQVWRAQAQDIDGKKGEVTVAVKTLKENASGKEKSDLLQELIVMKGLGTHPNVVRLLGCCTDKEPTLVIMEFVSLGKLQQFLRDSRAERHYGNTHGGSQFLTSRDLTHFAYQVARGMEFLTSKGIIHRDLAARNILITEERTCKVADFGFARDVGGTHVYERKSDGRLPIRWMAPESLYDDIFSVKSDIWSFGVLLWEIVTLGSTPYPGLSASDVMKKVRDGHRLEKPEHCRRELYNIMYYCWEAEPTTRPDFQECVSMLEKLLCTETDYIELERFPDHSYYNVQHLEGEKL